LIKTRRVNTSLLTWIRGLRLATLTVVLALASGLTGCDKGKPSGDPAKQTQAFQSAPAAIQAGWQLAIAAAATNDYATSILTLRRLQGQPDLTPEQKTAVNDRLDELNRQLAEALQKGDPNAAKAMQTMQQQGRSR
jgi:hypothetical protein